MGRKIKKSDTAQVNEELSGLDIRINEFGEIISTVDVKKINDFLDKNVEDKKFRGVEVTKRTDNNELSEA